MEDNQLLDISRLQKLLGNSPIGHSVDYHSAIDSTMPRAQALAQDPTVRAGHIVVAEQQLAGKGRRDRAWVTPYAQALLVSVILKPPLLPANPAYIPMAAGLAVCNALTAAFPELSDKVSLKWPNDVLLGVVSEGGKVAGILSESAFGSAGILYAILGIGVNVNQSPDELPPVEPRMTHPVSLRNALGKAVDRTQLLALLCQHLAAQFDPERTPDAIFDEFRARLSTLGQAVSVYTNAHSAIDTIRGIAVDISRNGELIVQDAEGAIHAFAAADVSLRPTADT